MTIYDSQSILQVFFCCWFFFIQLCGQNFTQFIKLPTAFCLSWWEISVQNERIIAIRYGYAASTATGRRWADNIIRAFTLNMKMLYAQLTLGDLKQKYRRAILLIEWENRTDNIYSYMINVESDYKIRTYFTDSQSMNCILIHQFHSFFS